MDDAEHGQVRAVRKRGQRFQGKSDLSITIGVESVTETGHQRVEQ
jgi:hypothetical protein